MPRLFRLIFVLSIFPFVAVMEQPAPIQAQIRETARTLDLLNLRPIQSLDSPIITQIMPSSTVILEARNANQEWILIHTPEGYLRGWVACDALAFPQDFVLSDLPVSAERLIATTVDNSDPTQPIYVYESIDVSAAPVLPEDMGRAIDLFTGATAAGRDPEILSKVGDCNTAGWVFLHPFGEERYMLGNFTELQALIEYYAEAFALRTYAAHNGLNVGAVLDPTWAEPSVCQPGESPLDCEYRLHNPSLAVIMFGTNDLLVLNALQFDYFLRRVVQKTIDANVVPLLSTFPEYIAYPERTKTFNQIVLQVATDYDVPVMNLWRALQDLPNAGIAQDGFHLNGPLTSAGDLSPENLETGFPMRNLVTLQALDTVWRAVILPGIKPETALNSAVN